MEDDEEFQAQLSDEDRRRMEAGEPLPLNIFLLRLKRAIERDQSLEPVAKESLLGHIEMAEELVGHISPPPDKHWENWRGGLAWHLAYECLAIGSEGAASGFEFGINGERLAAQMQAERDRVRGGETQKDVNKGRDSAIYAAIQKRMHEGRKYDRALQDVLDNWDEEDWGKRVSIKRLRNQFQKQSFTTPDPS